MDHHSSALYVRIHTDFHTFDINTAAAFHQGAAPESQSGTSVFTHKPQPNDESTELNNGIHAGRFA